MVQEGKISLALALKVLHIQSIWRFSGSRTSYRDALAQVQLWLSRAAINGEIDFGLDVSEITNSDIERYFPEISNLKQDADFEPPQT
jgi:hypothetical protein